MSSFNPTPAEIALTSNVFTIADPQKLGIVTGDTAVKVLSGANLSHAVLGEVWAIADKENNGFLTRKGVAIALRLIGHAQKGEPLTEDLLSKPGPLAHIDGVPGPATAGSPTPSSPAPHSSPSRPGSTLPPITPQDKAKFLKLFIGCGPVNGLLSGEKARDVFVKSKLPYEKLSQIWTLADSKARGSLDSTDFIIGMYLIQASMSSSTFILPTTLPSWIYDQALQRDASPAVSSHATGGSASGFGSPRQEAFPVPRQFTGSGATILSPNAMKTQYTGQSVPRQAPPVANATPATPFTSTPFHGQPQNQQWDVTAEAKLSSDRFFDTLDSQRRGYIEGDVAVPFMLGSKLNEDDLARIWDLADLHKDGKLTRDGFAVAMHLINSRLAGGEIPIALPPSLIPLTMRQSSVPMGTSGGAQPDLLGDDSPPNSAVHHQPTGNSLSGPARNGPVPTHNTGQGTLQNAFPPSAQSLAFQTVANKDLLGDDDDEPSKTNVVPDNSAEIGNLHNQITSTTRSHSTIQTERISIEQTVAQQASHLSQLQTQLSAAKASYETESRLLATLRERSASQRTEIQKTQEELIRAESDLSAAKVGKAEVEGSVLRDKEEIRDLQRRMKDVADQTDALKASIEKAKKDARQQKGLLAIAKKQLATAEAEKLKGSKELEAAEKELDVVRTERENLEAHVADMEASISALPAEASHQGRINSPAPTALAAGIPLPDTPQPVTPQRSASRQSTNPFERLAMASVSAGVGGNSPFPPLPTSSETTTSENGAVSSDLFGFDVPPTNSSMNQRTSPEPPLYNEDSSGTPKPALNMLANVDVGPSPPASGFSPSDNAPFLTPHSTGISAGQEGENDTSKGDHQDPEGTHDETEDVGDLKPLQEVDAHESDTSDSDDEPLGTKILTKKAIEQADTDNIPPPPVSKESIATGPTLSSPQRNFEDSSGGVLGPSPPIAASRTSPPTSGNSSPRRSRSPRRGSRPLSSHSISGVMDPFGASAFTQTPLEPPAGEAAPPPTIETVLEPSGSPRVALGNMSSINDFDEALGKLPSSTKDSTQAIKFDSAFDDNFDFSSATNGNADATASTPNANGFGGVGSEAPGSGAEKTFGTFPPVSSPINPSAPFNIGAQTTDVGMSSFGEAFSPQAPVSPASGDPSKTVSFDDAFGLSPSERPRTNGQSPTSNGAGFEFHNDTISGGTLPEPPTRASHGDHLSPVSSVPSPPLPPRTQPSPPLPREASPAVRPASPSSQPRVSSATHRPSSPPPPRASSPRLRVLSGSKSSSEGKSDGPSKHKLSIRFPFGRRDKTKDKEDKRAQSQAHHQILEQQQFLSPVTEPPPLPGRVVTPAVEDDAEPVKQLAAMGFSRTQSIAALETHGYDMQKALNSLLGAA